MDNSCGNCMSVWGCSWCKNIFCDDVCCPYRLEGKPTKIIVNNDYKRYLKTGFFYRTEKDIKKLIKEIEEREPEPQQFFLCEKCKSEYIEKNICKGRHKNKIGRNEITF